MLKWQRRLPSLALLICAFAVVGLHSQASAAQEEGEYPAYHAALDWLKLVDEGKYGESWDTASSTMKSGIGEDAWVSALQRVRGPLGTPTSRDLKASRYSLTLPGVQEGEYVVMDFIATFGNGRTSTETVIVMYDEDGSWRTLSYQIR